jgi:hypothetical protein
MSDISADERKSLSEYRKSRSKSEARVSSDLWQERRGLVQLLLDRWAVGPPSRSNAASKELFLWETVRLNLSRASSRKAARTGKSAGRPWACQLRQGWTFESKADSKVLFLGNKSPPGYSVEPLFTTPR